MYNNYSKLESKAFDACRYIEIVHYRLREPTPSLHTQYYAGLEINKRYGLPF
jgi:hypothetical protein